MTRLGLACVACAVMWVAPVRARNIVDYWCADRYHISHSRGASWEVDADGNRLWYFYLHVGDALVDRVHLRLWRSNAAVEAHMAGLVAPEHADELDKWYEAHWPARRLPDRLFRWDKGTETLFYRGKRCVYISWSDGDSLTDGDAEAK